MKFITLHCDDGNTRDFNPEMMIMIVSHKDGGSELWVVDFEYVFIVKETRDEIRALIDGDSVCPVKVSDAVEILCDDEWTHGSVESIHAEHFVTTKSWNEYFFSDKGRTWKRTESKL